MTFSVAKRYVGALLAILGAHNLIVVFCRQTGVQLAGVRNWSGGTGKYTAIGGG